MHIIIIDRVYRPLIGQCTIDRNKFVSFLKVFWDFSIYDIWRSAFQSDISVVLCKLY